MAAAKAGGIMANTESERFFLNNIQIQNSLLQMALKKKLGEQFILEHLVFILNSQRLL